MVAVYKTVYTTGPLQPKLIITLPGAMLPVACTVRVAEVGVVGAGGVAVGVGGVKRTGDSWMGPGKLELQEGYARLLRGERALPAVRTREMRAGMESRIWRFCMVAR